MTGRSPILFTIQNVMCEEVGHLPRVEQDGSVYSGWPQTRREASTTNVDWWYKVPSPINSEFDLRSARLRSQWYSRAAVEDIRFVSI